MFPVRLIAQETGSPEEEGQRGPLHWDTYMPPVGDDDQAYTHYEKPKKRARFAVDVLSKIAVAGDRSTESDGSRKYYGSRVISRLQALGLPTVPVDDASLFRKESC